MREDASDILCETWRGVRDAVGRLQSLHMYRDILQAQGSRGGSNPLSKEIADTGSCSNIL